MRRRRLARLASELIIIREPQQARVLVVQQRVHRCAAWGNASAGEGSKGNGSGGQRAARGAVLGGVYRRGGRVHTGAATQGQGEGSAAAGSRAVHRSALYKSRLASACTTGLKTASTPCGSGRERSSGRRALGQSSSRQDSRSAAIDQAAPVQRASKRDRATHGIAGSAAAGQQRTSFHLRTAQAPAVAVSGISGSCRDA